MNLTELFDTDIAYKVMDDSSSRFWVNAKINDRTIGVFFYQFSDIEDKDSWELIFAEKSKDDRHPWDHNLTGSGGEMKVFALIKKLLGVFLAKHDPRVIQCSASKTGNRSRLYKKLLSKIPNYKLEQNDTGHDTIFKLVKI